jgi:cellulose synthase/poly-beta-1,6-N-acetylglucosamine synthase-like glycosyltransferase
VDFAQIPRLLADGLPTDADKQPRMIVLVPAHNEAATISLALRSLERQVQIPDLVIVVADNCTDNTVEVVSGHRGAVVVSSIANHDKKAGALNQALSQILPHLADHDAVMVMDADSEIDPYFIRSALVRLGGRERRGRRELVVGGVGGTFRGGRGGGFVGMLQRNEYARYARDVRRLKGRVLVLTGTAAIFTVDALRAVIAGRRSGKLPGGGDQVYGTGVLTEDNELTLALLHLGYAIVSPKECLLETEVMTNWRTLWTQRVRWKRGALENLIDYGLTRVTARYWGRQLVTHIGVLVTMAYLATIVISLAVAGTVHLHPLWISITLIFVAERVITVNARGWRQMTLASTLIVEMAFDLFLQAAQVKALWDTVTHSAREW